jgi:hypothetical protein
MSEYQLTTDVHITPTPLGAYYAVSSPEPEPARALILGMMSSDRTQPVSMDALSRYTGDTEDPLSLLYRMECAHWIEGRAESEILAARNIETDVPQLLSQLSGNGKALLTDSEGFYLANAGLAHELAEDLAIFAAEVATIQRKQSDLIRGNLRLGAPAMAVVDSGGNSELGFWPIHIGEHQFMLIVSGAPLFDRPAYLHLVWALCQRYNS